MTDRQMTFNTPFFEESLKPDRRPARDPRPALAVRHRARRTDPS